ncbi:Peptidase C39 family protein [Apibacter mensalis]|uniref:Peptidase C39 family protein n=1 Tax=Apibacter mensalis TaxID=1586267 RepID=A0A0X3APT8_9FLAO|nr:Peptidase C39 family protein [Apibacter mensalis]
MHHYVVIYKVHKNIVSFMDPAKGKIEAYKIEEFAKIWTGMLILLEPNEYFEQRNDKIGI